MIGLGLAVAVALAAGVEPLLVLLEPWLGTTVQVPPLGAVGIGFAVGLGA